MREEMVQFFSDGDPVAGILHSPDGPGNGAAIVQGPGWLGLKDAKLYLPYHEALTDAGFSVLIFDYRGFGDSGGDRGTLSPRMQLEDLVNAVTYLETRPEIDEDRISAFGSGGTGGGNAVLLAATDPRIRCAVSQVPVADGADWLRRMRSTVADWEAFVERVNRDRRDRVLTGKGQMVHPREEIMIPSQERRQTSVKKDVDGRVPTSVPLAAAEEIMAYRPVSAARQVEALMVIAVDGDVVTPTDHAEDLFDAAMNPKKMVMQYNTTHYAAYQQYGPVVIPQIVEWFERHQAGPVGESEEREDVGR
jgi:dipeptidyl aminopeptidase/acylaminoacyl peptidase